MRLKRMHVRAAAKTQMKLAWMCAQVYADNTDRTAPPLCLPATCSSFACSFSNSIACAKLLLKAQWHRAEALRRPAEQAEDFRTALHDLIQMTSGAQAHYLLRQRHDDAWFAEATQKRGLLNSHHAGLHPHLLDAKNVSMLNPSRSFRRRSSNPAAKSPWATTARR